MNKDSGHLKELSGSLEEPDVSADLVNYLDTLFPEQSADLQWSDRDVWYRSGQRSVVRFLKQKLKEQEENIL